MTTNTEPRDLGPDRRFADAVAAKTAQLAALQYDALGHLVEPPPPPPPTAEQERATLLAREAAALAAEAKAAGIDADLAAARPGPGDPDAGARRPAPVLHGHAAAIAAAEVSGDWALASRLKADGLLARTLGHPDIRF